MRNTGRPRGRGARMVGAAALVVPLLALPPADAGVGSPIAEIVNPEDAKVFRPGDLAIIDGNAFAGLGVYAVKLEFWLLNKMQRAVLAQCNDCRTGTETHWTYAVDDLLPGYYIVKAYAVDNAGNFSPAAQRGFAYGLQAIQPPTPPPVPAITPPGAIPPPSITTPVTPALPGATAPVTIGGQTAEPGQQVRIKEQTLGPVGVTRSDEDAAWSFTTRLPTGNYRFRVRAQDDEGRSRWSRIYRIAVDADRPILGITTVGDTVFLPTEPVVIEGTLGDEQAPARIRLQYWLLDDMVLQDDVTCLACDQQRFAWEHRPEGLEPGYYTVKISAYDAAGNPSHNASTTFAYALGI